MANKKLLIIGGLGLSILGLGAAYYFTEKKRKKDLEALQGSYDPETLLPKPTSTGTRSPLIRKPISSSQPVSSSVILGVSKPTYANFSPMAPLCVYSDWQEDLRGVYSQDCI